VEVKLTEATANASEVLILREEIKALREAEKEARAGMMEVRADSSSWRRSDDSGHSATKAYYNSFHHLH